MMNIGLLFECIYVNVQYDMWLLWGNMFPPTLGEQFG